MSTAQQTEIIVQGLWILGGDLIGVPGMPSHSRGLRRWGEDKLRKTRKELGLKGNGWAYAKSCLPAITQEYIDELYLKTSLSHVANESKKLRSTDEDNQLIRNRGIFHGGSQYTQKQTSIADAKAVVLLALDQLKVDFKYGKQKAINHLNHERSL